LFGLNDLHLVGVSADDRAASIGREVASIVAGVGDLLGMPSEALRRKIEIDDGFTGQGYGVPSTESAAALALVARTEGIMLDPVYTAKAMAALLARVSEGAFVEKESILFWHTGGQLALFTAAGEG
jgi:1-aminocyclopropane-1-carboxylate deaminase/D-cysteine desulfhydrase-like pyridoxal-dependent ACC family enzyme